MTPYKASPHEGAMQTTDSSQRRDSLPELCPSPILMAPMVGLSHFAVRAAAAEFLPWGGKALWYTEMLNSRRVPSQHPGETPEVCFADSKNGLCPQLLANEDRFIQLSVPRLESWGARAIDINMGCPVNKALKHNYGVALMGDPDYAESVVRMTVAAAKVPISVKLRAGLEHFDEGFLFDFVDRLFEAGAEWITLHPRTAEQQRKGKPNFDLLARLKARSPHRWIIGNGDVQCWEDVVRMREQTGCDRVMVGRAILAKPWLMAGDRWQQGEPDPYEQGEALGRFLKQVVRYSSQYYEEPAGLRRMRFLIRYAKPWIEYGEYLQGRVDAAKSYPELNEALNRFFTQKQKIIARTELRV